MALIARPEAERQTYEFINDWDRVPVFGQINCFDVRLAGFARFQTDVLNLLCDVHADLFFVLFAARGTNDPAVFPFRRAE